MHKVMIKTIEMVETVTTTSQQLEEEVTWTVETDHIDNKHKVMLYKLFVVFYHHSQLFLSTHKYCMMNPEDVLTCQDPMIFSQKLGTVYKKIMDSASLMQGLVSCMRHGARPLLDEINLGSTPLEKVLGVAGNVMWRSLHYVGSGQLAKRVHRLAKALVRKTWEYRSELMLLGVIAFGAQPLMAAMTATGITTGVATSASLVFEQLGRNFFVYVGCPIIKSPFLMSMLVRWAMHKIILQDYFIDGVIKPLWKFGKATLAVVNPMALVGEALLLSWSTVKGMLEKIRDTLASTSNQTAATENVQKTWLEVAREFHATPAADVLYGTLSTWLGMSWRVIMTASCSAAKVLLTTVNGVEAVVDVSGHGVDGLWRTISSQTSNFFKWVSRDDSRKLVADMVSTDNRAYEASKMMAPKALKVMHELTSKADMVASATINGVLDGMLEVLGLFTSSSAVSYILARFFAWTWQSFYDPNPKTVAVHEDSLRVALDNGRTSFNTDSCQAKPPGASCMFLDRAGLEREAVTAGICCRAICQPVDETCVIGCTSEDAKLADQELDPTGLSLKRLAGQSEYLHSFVKMAQKSYGSHCITDPE